MHRPLSDAGTGGGEAVPGEGVQVRILLEPGLEILGAHQIVRIMVHGSAVHTIEAGLHLVHGEQRVGATGCLRLTECRQRSPNSIRAHQWVGGVGHQVDVRSEEHTSELQSLMRISYAVFCLKKKNTTKIAYHNQER